jgi:protoheme IX farnesyltransferase
MVTGDTSLFPWLMFLLIFIWTPPHFWALALFANADYKAANIPMMPLVKGPQSTKRQSLFYTLVLLPLAVAPTLLGYAGWLYGIAATVLTTFFIFTALRVLRSEDMKYAKMMFGYSIFYLFALFLSLMLDHT